MATVATATPGAGNTSAAPSGKSRAFQLTLNDVSKYSSVFDYLTGRATMDYLISCEEQAPTTGHVHRHIYVHYKTPIKLSLKKCLGAHVEVCRGTPQQNIDYIRKNGNIVDEIGQPPQQGGIRVKDLKAAATPDELPWQMHNTWTKIHAEMDNDIDIDDWHKDVEVIYIHGPSGIGKTEKAKEIVRESDDHKVNVVKCVDGFWHGIGTAKTAIYDDFRDSHMPASEFINFIDYNVHNLNIKGGSKKNEYNRIIITSVQDPNEIYHNLQGEPRQQWIRRMRIIRLTMFSATDDDM